MILYNAERERHLIQTSIEAELVKYKMFTIEDGTNLKQLFPTLTTHKVQWKFMAYLNQVKAIKYDDDIPVIG